MYLKKLTLRGFKSFASATSLSLEPGITCIVGPNGSGKSNVVDALAWVMGEQGAKSLRGASMEDVIFAGTSSRAPLGRAEIQLTIDNADGALPIDYSEVTISRTKFRNGSSEYAINGTTCRLLDVRELLSDSGIGRELHVIVGQGELDQILTATPESRRGFVEEAAGVLKHRERKEKALRKLEATAGNLNRLTDLITEIRRQLKPLGRQAEVAKRAAGVQADLRDAKARLLADDLAQAGQSLADHADTTDSLTRRAQVEVELAEARSGEDASREAMAEQETAYRRMQETWFGLSGIAERVRSLLSLAGERVRYATTMPVADPNPARDPQTLLAQADQIAEDEARLRGAIDGRRTALEQATAERAKAEADHSEAERQFEAASRSSALHREDLARLSGQLTSLAAKVEAAATRLAQLQASHQAAQGKADAAEKDSLAAHAELPSGDGDRQSLADAREAAQEALNQARDAVEAARGRVQSLTEAKAGLAARVEALRLAQRGQDDAGAWITAESGVSGLLGPLAGLVRVEPGFERAVEAGLGALAEAVVVRGFAQSLDALQAVRSQQRGRADFLIAEGAPRTNYGDLPAGARPLVSLLSGEPAILDALAHVVGPVMVVDSLDQARTVIEARSDLTVVTPDGDRLSSWLVSGGAASGQSAIQIASALGEAETKLAEVSQQVGQAEVVLEQAQTDREQAVLARDQAVQGLDQFDKAQSAVALQASRLKQAWQLADADARRYAEQVAHLERETAQDQQRLADLQQRLSQAQAAGDVAAPDPGQRDELAEAAKRARAAEMEARLGLRTVEERVRSLAGQAESLRRSAEAERASRAEAEQRRQALLAQAEVARSVVEAGRWLAARVSDCQALAERRRDEVGQERAAAQAQAEQLRVRIRDLTTELEALIDSAHREELARTQQQMRIDALAERAMAEVGLDVATLMSQYGPDQLVPTGVDEQGEPVGVPYVRDEQLKRLRTAERDLQLLGKINPLAMEEFDAMQERHGFLSAQLEDLKKTRADLLSIVDDVDARVQEVFSAAYADVEREFAVTFPRLFPGGEGRLVLTEPGQWLTTGIDVEARPAGKNVKRLSLLSGGERSLVAVCFLVALFKARPSPFYVLDEVEAALDDTNVGRLLEIYEELRATSQLLVITHQKRTMEIADTLYGVAMGSDGTSTVVSQRLREDTA